MTAATVASLYTELEDIGVRIWIDGGWGVDALLGRQTRAHQDLDIAIEEGLVSRLRAFLEQRGYKEIKLEQARPWNFVLGDQQGREVDVHVIAVDEQGDGIYGPKENDEMYPADSLTGAGSILGRSVRCISPEWTVKFHSGYKLKEKDFLDVSAVCKKFGIDLPQRFAAFRNAER